MDLSFFKKSLQGVTFLAPCKTKVKDGDGNYKSSDAIRVIKNGQSFEIVLPIPFSKLRGEHFELIKKEIENVNIPQRS